MKGIFGIWMALLLGVAGAFCNWFYLAQAAKGFEEIDFIAVGEAPINPGDRFTESSFVKLRVPALHVGWLESSAVRYKDLNTVVGLKATRGLAKGQVLLLQDLEQPPPPDVKANLGPDEKLMWLPLDTSLVVTSLLKAGDSVWFVVPPLVRAPTPATGSTPASDTRVIGPYRILGMGTRLGSSEKLLAVGGSTRQENLMAVAVTLKDGKLDPAGEELSKVLAATNFKGVQVLLDNDRKKR